MALGWSTGWALVGLVGLVGLAAVGCGGASDAMAVRQINLYQTWALQPGDQVGPYRVQSGLGDVAVTLGGASVYMPFAGRVQPDADRQDRCVIVFSPEVPAYLFRLCGLLRPRLGDLPSGDVIGRGEVVAFAALRKQADGTWAMVEPAQDLLVQFLSQP